MGGAKITSDTEDLSSSLSMSPEQSATVEGVIKVPSDNTYFGKTVDIFAVGFHSPETHTCSGKSEDGQYYMLVTVPVDNPNQDDTSWFNVWNKEDTRVKTFKEWDGSLTSLKPFRTGVKLNELVTIPIITNSKFPNSVQGLLCITFGYHVTGTEDTNTWIFNETSIDINFLATNRMIVNQIIDLNTDLAFVMTDENKETVIATYGDKDAKGNLTSVSGMSMVSVSDPKQVVNIELNKDNPQEFTIEFADRAKIRVNNYDTDNKKADLTVVQMDNQGNETQVGKFKGQPIELPNKPLIEDEPFALADAFAKDLQEFSYHMINEIMGMMCNFAPPILQLSLSLGEMAASKGSKKSICHPYNGELSKETLNMKLNCYTTPIENLSVIQSLGSLASCKHLSLITDCIEGLVILGEYVLQKITSGSNGGCEQQSLPEQNLPDSRDPCDLTGKEFAKVVAGANVPAPIGNPPVNCSFQQWCKEVGGYSEAVDGNGEGCWNFQWCHWKCTRNMLSETILTLKKQCISVGGDGSNIQEYVSDVWNSFQCDGPPGY
jgi:hypothetical protein